VTVPMDCQLIGRWRIVEADLWDRAHLDLVEPAMMTIGCHGRGEITFGAMRGRLELEYSRSTVFFTWAGFEEMDEVSGSGSAELQDDGSLAIAFAYDLGDEAILKAVRRLLQQPVFMFAVKPLGSRVGLQRVPEVWSGWRSAWRAAGCRDGG
jgi:hypothetical protein